MTEYRLSDLLDMGVTQKMADAFYNAAGMPIGIIDAIDGSILVGSGWQDICVKFHRVNPILRQRCQESDNFIKNHLVEGHACQYKCQNGLMDIGVPIVVEGRHLATMFLGQFFYEDETPEREFFIQLAQEFGFDLDDYLAALDRVPRLSHEKVNGILEYNMALTNFLAGLAENSLKKIQAEEKIRASEQKFHAIFDQTFQCIVLLSTDGRILEVNNTAVQFSGIRHAETVGKLFWETHWWSHSSELQEKTRLAVQRVAKGAFVRFEATHPAADGTLHYVDFSLKPVKDQAGAVVLLIAEGRDITERKKAEQALQFTQFAVDHIRDAAYWTGPDGRLLYVNEASCRALGYTREELLSMTVSDIRPVFPPEVWSEHWQELRERKTFIFESILKRKDGSVFPVEACVNYVLFGGNEYNCAFVRDISERKRVESELVKAHKLESVGLLAGGIAHDFNNILTGIMGNASLAKMSLSPQDKAYKYVDNLETASYRAKDLTQQFLTFSKGGAPIKKRTSAAEIIRSSMQLALSGLKSTGELTIPDDLWFVDADEGQVSQVIINLIINADQAMPKGGNIRGICENIELDEANSFFLKKGMYVRISITDQGMGIPEEYLGKIFDPYFTTKEKGRGLGLASAYAIMKNHDGHISVESQIGVGSTFSLYLPASVLPVIEQVETAEIVSGKEKILVMDDEEMVSTVVGEMLEHLGYNVAFAQDGEQALAMYSEALTSGRPFDAVIMDLTIPGGMGGKEALRRILQIDPDVRAIVSSGYSNDPVMADFRQYGFAGMVEKPFNLEKLSEQVSKVLRR